MKKMLSLLFLLPVMALSEDLQDPQVYPTYRSREYCEHLRALPCRQGLFVAIRSASPGISAFKVIVRYQTKEGLERSARQFVDALSDGQLTMASASFFLEDIKPLSVYVEPQVSKEGTMVLFEDR